MHTEPTIAAERDAAAAVRPLRSLHLAALALLPTLAIAQEFPPTRAVTHGPRHHWFAYYDVEQFDASGRYLLGMEVDFEHRSPRADDVVKIGMIDLEGGERWIELGETRAWSWQQGCRLQWRPGAKSEVLWNDREGGEFVSRVLDVETGRLRTLPLPIYHVSPDGRWALGTDFARIDDMRPGYGYDGVPDPHREVMAPEDSGIYRMDLDTGEHRLLFSIAEVAARPYDGARPGDKHYFNHIEWNPAGTRFLFLDRWRPEGGRGFRTRMLTADADGGDLRFVTHGASHYTWRDPEHVLVWLRGAYHLFRDDGRGAGTAVFEAPNGHQSYLPDRDWLLSDTYPTGPDRVQTLYLVHLPTGRQVILGRFPSPPAYRGEWRVDLHPRLSPDGTRVVVDSAHGGEGRQMYMIDIADVLAAAAREIAEAPRTREVEDAEYAWLQRQLAERAPGDAAYRRRMAVLHCQTLRRDALILVGDRDPCDVAVRRTRALLDDLRARADAPELGAAEAALEALERCSAEVPPAEGARRRALFGEVLRLRRRIAFANPLLDFDRILFLEHHPSRYDHMVDQYFGFHAEPGGGVFVLEDPFGDEPRVRDLLAGARIENGRLEGRSLAGGSFISLELDFDAQTILFAWTEADPVVAKFSDHIPHEVLWKPESTYHIFKAGVDGAGLTQLTDGSWNEFDPCFLPSGRIAFVSERRGGYLRCGVRPDPTYTLHGMEADGTGIAPLSYHETHEWHPSVDHDGMIVYTRWDYVDRDSDIAHHLWLTFPDGRDPRSFHGNYPEMRESRPWMEMAIRAVPGSKRYVAVATPHHGQNYGSLVLIDHLREDDGAMAQVKRITPDACLPESEVRPGEPGPRHAGRNNGKGERYATPWPLSEDYYLCVHAPDGENFGVYLIDSFGNRERLFADPAIACLDPIPLRERPRPPVIPDRTGPEGGAPELAATDRATVALIDVHYSDFAWPADTTITAVRVIQLFPKSTPAHADPRIGWGEQALARGVLGTAPVEADGSAYFEVPARVPVYFQALDERGLAVQSMRSDTYLHPGERLACLGCHEPKHRAPGHVRTTLPLALQRPASKLAPDVSGSFPLQYPRLVQGVLDRHCADCHAGEDEAPALGAVITGPHGWSESFAALAPHGWALHGGNGALARNGSSRSIAGRVGARASNLFRMLEAGHHDVKLSPGDLHRIALWLDCNTNFYGAYHDLDRQARGEVVLPSIY